jgi:hypothetical protein
MEDREAEEVALARAVRTASRCRLQSRGVIDELMPRHGMLVDIGTGYGVIPQGISQPFSPE